MAIFTGGRVRKLNNSYPTYNPSCKSISSDRDFPYFRSFLRTIRMLNIMFIFNSCQCSSAVVAIAKYEYLFELPRTHRFLYSKSDDYHVGGGLVIYWALRNLKRLKSESNGPQQPCHWLYNMNGSLSSLRNKTQYLHGLEMIENAKPFYFS